MKRKIWIHHLLGTLFAFGLSVSTAGCLATGFDLPVASMVTLIIRCGIISLICALLLRFRFGGSVLLCMSAFAAFLLWKHSSMWEQIQTMLLDITSEFHQCYNWPAFGAMEAEKVDLALMAISWWTAISVSYCFCRRKSLIVALPSVVLPLTVCLIVTNTVPDAFYLYLLILGSALLLLTDWVRRNNSAQGISLTLRMAIPVAVALAVLFTLNSRESYVNNAAELQKRAVTWFQQLQSFSQEIPLGGTDAIGTQRLNLRAVGPKNNLSYAVMRINSPIDGTLYLRGQDYDTYTGTGWESSEDRSEVFTTGTESLGTLTITTYGTRNLLYVPYYPAEEIQLSGGFADNSGNLTRYSYELTALAQTDYITDGAIEGESIRIDIDISTVETPELALGDSRLWAVPLAEEITEGCWTDNDKVRAIGDYVRNSATYDLATSRMSTESEDFARWFLKESDTGYCVHFATAATVLLRASGIPARYVEGYMVTCRAGDPVVVSNQSAHAWAEYYDAESGVWRVLEATPAMEEEGGETAPETEATLPTEAEETEPSETQTEASSPDENDETEPVSTQNTSEIAQPKKPFKIPQWVKSLLCLLLALASVVLQGEIRIVLKRRQWNKGKPNEMALTRWKQSERLARLVKLPLPEELDTLAQKAKFSQHTLTREELRQFDQFYRDALKTLNTQSLYRKWFLRWILAIG